MTWTTAVRRTVTLGLTSCLGGCMLLIGPVPADVVQTDAAAVDATDSGPATPDVARADAGSPDVSWSDAFGVPTWPDAGSLAPPEWVPLTIGPIGTCTALSPCGGDIVGTWDTGGGCFEIDLESVLAPCPGAVVTRRVGRGRGRVVFGADGIGHRVADAEAEVDFYVPAICASYYSCAMIQSASAALVTEATCTTGPTGDCSCVARQINHFDQADFYTTASNEIVSRSSGKHWEYCVGGDTLTYRDTSPSGAREPGTIVLRRR
ncbi:MAG: hypothetical protein WCJ30_16160 [Deltaproteobacteria bacterium]